MKCSNFKNQFIESCIQLTEELNSFKGIHTSLHSDKSYFLSKLFLYLEITSESGFFSSLALQSIYKFFPFQGDYFFVVFCSDGIRVHFTKF